MSTPVPSWCPAALAESSAARAKAPLSSFRECAAQVDACSARLRAEQLEVAGVRLMMVHLAGREQSVALAVRETGGGDVLEVLSLADERLDDKKFVAALAQNGQPRLAGFVTLDVNGQPHLFARAANLVETLDDDELDRMLLATARLADDWEARQSQGGDQW